MDRNFTSQPDVRYWSETRWLGTWNPDVGVGFFLHAGRFRHDVDLWWAQTVVYLPDGKVGVDRSWGRDRDERGVRTSVFELLVEKPAKLITSTFDGAMEIATGRQLADRPYGSGGNGVPMRWNLEAEALREPWSIYDQIEVKQGWADSSHKEQHHIVRGELTVGNDTYQLDGHGFDDHSNGIRQWGNWGSHIFITVSFEDFGLHVIAEQTPDRTPKPTIGAITRDGAEVDPITGISVPLIEDMLGAPHTFHASMTTRSGKHLDVDIEVVHTFPMSIPMEHNDNINGLDWDVPGDTLFFTECIARFTTSDGQVGYGHLERSARRDQVDRNTLAVRDPWSLLLTPAGV